MSNQQTIALVTGSNRGIGRSIAAELLAVPNTVVYAAVRNPESSKEQLAELQKGAASGSELRTVKLDSSRLEDAAAAAAEVRKHTDRVDIVIANAGSESGSDDVILASQR